MIPKELYDKVRRIQITSSRMVNDVFAGQYKSVFKGRGMEFDEVREYQFGDDVRTIDWNVTARTGKPYIKKYVEERELTVMVIVDASASCHFASVNALKSKLAAEIAAVVAFSAIRNNDKVGLIIFTDRIECFIPPRKGVQNVLKVIRDVLYFEPKGEATDIAGALEFLSKVTTRQCVTFLISDFFDKDLKDDAAVKADSRLKKALSIAAKRHDLIAVTLNDPRENELPECGLLTLEDAETKKQVLVDTTDRRLRDVYKEKAVARRKKCRQLFGLVGIDSIDIDTDRPYAPDLVKFFAKRQRRLR